MVYGQPIIITKFRSSAIAAAAVLIVAAPPLALLALDRPNDPELLRPADPPDAVRAIQIDHRPEATGRLTLEWGSPPVVVAPGWVGVVTGAPIGSGVAVAEGAVVAAVDNIDRIAVRTAAPFFRPLPLGASGDDVAELQSVLMRLGLLDGEHIEAGTVGAFTQAAIEQLAGRLRAPFDPQVGFDPTWVAWTPSAEFVVTSRALDIGGAAPAAGTQILTGAAPLLAAHLELGNAGAQQDAPATWLATIDGHEPISLEVDADGSVAPTSLDALADTFAMTDVEVDASLVAATGVPAVALPANSVVVDPDGTACAWSRPSAGAPWAQLTFAGVTEVGGTIVVESPGDIDQLVGRDILADPVGHERTTCR